MSDSPERDGAFVKLRNGKWQVWTRKCFVFDDGTLVQPFLMPGDRYISTHSDKLSAVLKAKSLNQGSLYD